MGHAECKWYQLIHEWESIFNTWWMMHKIWLCFFRSHYKFSQETNKLDMKENLDHT